LCSRRPRRGRGRWLPNRSGPRRAPAARSRIADAISSLSRVVSLVNSWVELFDIVCPTRQCGQPSGSRLAPKPTDGGEPGEAGRKQCEGGRLGHRCSGEIGDHHLAVTPSTSAPDRRRPASVAYPKGRDAAFRTLPPVSQRGVRPICGSSPCRGLVPDADNLRLDIVNRPADLPDSLVEPQRQAAQLSN